MPLIGMVGRLSGQKGLDLVECVLNEIMDDRRAAGRARHGRRAKYVDLFSWAQSEVSGSAGGALRR